MSPDRKAYLSAACRDILDTLTARCSGLMWASVATRDGIEIASIGAPNEKLSVMVSTMHALADAVASEAALGESYSLIQEAGHGRVVILSVPGGADNLVLAGMAEPNTSLGMLLSLCTMACKEVALASPDSHLAVAGTARAIWHGADV